ncbi:HTH-type quorum sensing-dependent transcriptional regulator RpaR [Thalassocella blandensis]|nr:HTH-type quorum sensing-dependent transcriptional regulator RpaR [Thalassocella blandensis]
MNPHFESFLSESRASFTIDDLFGAYTRFMETCGFNRVAYVIISDHDELKQEHPLGIIRQSNLNGWDQYYIEQNFMEVDPLFEETYCKSGIFSWQEFRDTRQLSAAQTNFFNEAVSFGKLFQGVTFSVHGPCGTKGVAIASTDERKREFNPLSIDSANLATYQFHLCYLDVMRFESTMIQPLSSKEHLVLQWAATGLTKSGIGDRMRISSHTVDYHMRNVMKKLNAKNTTAALVTAIKKGIISP